MTPHIIYILSDEHRGQAMSHTGDPNVKTPTMDRLAREGVSFASACANCPICTPSRGTIFSGRHAHAGPVQGFFDNYKATAPSTATHLRQHGYHTAYVGKWHMGIVRDQRPKTVRENPEEYGGESSRTPERHRAGFQDWFGDIPVTHPMIHSAAGFADRDELASGYAKQADLYHEFSPAVHLSKDDPPVLLTYHGKLDDRKNAIHHPIFGARFRDHARRIGAHCILDLPQDPEASDKAPHWQDFLKENLSK